MNPRANDQGILPRTTKTLLSGSVADDDPSRLYHNYYPSRYSGSYDPFSAVPQNRYSPPRTTLPEHSDLTYQSKVQDGSFTPYSPYAGWRSNTHLDSHKAAPQECIRMTDDTKRETSSRRTSQGFQDHHDGSPTNLDNTHPQATPRSQRGESGTTPTHQPNRRRAVNQDEFDGPSQYLALPLPADDHDRIQDLPELPVHLDTGEQNEILRRHNEALVDCAFHFVAKYQFPIPLERERQPVRIATDRDWTEWAYLLKRLATKRRIPARVLHANQIKHLVTILENSVVVRHSTQRDQPNSKKMSKDDKYILQLLSAGIQVARILMDSLAMRQLMTLYDETETIILERRRLDHIALMHY